MRQRMGDRVSVPSANALSCDCASAGEESKTKMLPCEPTGSALASKSRAPSQPVWLAVTETSRHTGVEVEDIESQPAHAPLLRLAECPAEDLLKVTAAVEVSRERRRNEIRSELAGIKAELAELERIKLALCGGTTTKVKEPSECSISPQTIDKINSWFLSSAS